jgi:hypothetical protein
MDLFYTGGFLILGHWCQEVGIFDTNGFDKQGPWGITVAWEPFLYQGILKKPFACLGFFGIN